MGSEDGVDQGDTGCHHAVFAIDPGGTTGVAAGYVDLKSTLKETLQNRSRCASVEVPGEWDQQAREIAGLFATFVETAVARGVPHENIHLVIEDFILRRRQAGGATGNLTSVWVAAAFIGYTGLASANASWQQPSGAKGLATNDRLRLWGMYEPGSEHCKDAWRHFAVKVNELISRRG